GADGQSGVGEAAPLPSYAGGPLDEANAALEVLARGLLGAPAGHAWDDSPPSLRGISPGAAAAARCGIETATADLLARSAGISFATWLGVRSGLRPSRYGVTKVPLNGTIDACSVEAAITAASAFVAAGFRTLKMKVGVDSAADLERVRAVREAIGPKIALRIDANGAWTFDDAARLLPLYAEFGVELCEQPIPHRVPGALQQMAALRRLSPVRIAADESCRSESELAAIIAANAADAIVVKPMVAGLRESIAMLARAERAGTPVIVTTLFESGVGVAMTAHLAALVGSRAAACGLATLGHLEASLITEPPRIEHGWLHVSPGPGLGVTIDEGVLAAYAAGPLRELSL
ncbi:MAG: mandelate racemase/muconate lactonizing enzyme family protein, partial [Tepidiformaceae bacterium]